MMPHSSVCLLVALILHRYVARAIDKEQEENEVLVHFERWNSRYDEYIKISSQRLRALLPERREKLQKERGKTKKVSS